MVHFDGALDRSSVHDFALESAQQQQPAEVVGSVATALAAAAESGSGGRRRSISKVQKSERYLRTSLLQLLQYQLFFAPKLRKHTPLTLQNRQQDFFGLPTTRTLLDLTCSEEDEVPIIK